MSSPPPAPRSVLLPLLALAACLALFVFLAARWLTQEVAEPASAQGASVASGADSSALQAAAGVSGIAASSVQVAAKPAGREAAAAAGAEGGVGVPAAGASSAHVGGVRRGESVRVHGGAVYSDTVLVWAAETELARQNQIWAQGVRAGRQMKGERVSREQMAADLYAGDWVAQVIFVAGFEWGSL